jgi:L,D-transpeptidase YcbB
MHKFKFVLVVLFFNNILFANTQNTDEVKSNEVITQVNQTLEKTQENLPQEKTFEEKSQESVKELLKSNNLVLFFTKKRVLKNYYKINNNTLFWIDEKGIKEIALTLLETVKNDPVLKPQSNKLFKLDKIVDSLNSLDKSSDKYIESMTKIDFMLTEIYNKYMNYLSQGIINWAGFKRQLKDLKEAEIIADWEKVSVKKDFIKLLKESIDSNNLSIAFKEVDYTFPKANDLANAINELEKIIQNGGYTKIPESKTLKSGVISSNVKILRKRLLESNDLLKNCENVVMAESIVTNHIPKENVTEESKIKDVTNIISQPLETPVKTVDCEEVFDDELKNAVISFQKDHGLFTDGEVGPNTRKHLNISAETKIDKIRLNLERMRWLPRTLGEKFLMVNIPDYTLKMYDNNEVNLQMGVVVGERKHPTPIFSDKMSFIVLNPYWRIPPRIVEREIIPKLIADPNYLNGRGINIHQSWDHTSEPLALNSIDWNMYNPQNVESKDLIPLLPPLRLIQEPSEKNPLGRIKFMFPNKYSVYMHDTPAKSLFKRTRRAFSHGCIRLAQPKELLKAISSIDKKLDYNKANEILKEIDKTTIGLDKKIPVHIVYLTSWVDENGKLQFRDDIYNYDRIQKKLMY